MSRYWILFLSVSLLAHDLYLLPAKFRVQAGSTLRVAFHNGDSFPASEVAPHVARLKDAKISGSGGSAAVQNLREAGKETIGEVTVSSQGSLLVSVETVPNFIELEPKKFEDYLKEEGLTEVIEWRKKNGESAKAGRERYTKFAKSLVVAGKSDGYYGHELGFAIEIIPLAMPKAGGKLPVRVLFRGKPAPGLQIETAWATKSEGKTMAAGRTDSDGRLDVSIGKAGLWRLHALKMERCADQKAADWESSWASLTFEVGAN